MPLAAFTDGPHTVSLTAGVSKLIVPGNVSRTGLLLCNGSLVSVLLAFGGVDPTAQLYSWKLAPGEQWAVPLYGTVQEVRAMCASLLLPSAGFTYTEFDLG